MSKIEKILEKEGILVTAPLSQIEKNEISMFVAKSLYSKFPTLKFNLNILYANIKSLNMFYAQMDDSASAACYYYKNSAIYFKEGTSIETLKKLAVHECIHHFQQVKSSSGKLYRLGLCSFLGNNAFGKYLNEASVQLMASFAISEKNDSVKYYGITFPTNSPNYYPMITNLIKQIGYSIGYSTLFESTFYADTLFFEKFKAAFGKQNAYKIQDYFDLITNLEEKISSLNSRILSEDLPHDKFQKITKKISKLKNRIQTEFFNTQNLIISSFYNRKLKTLDTPMQIVQFRKSLYNHINLIGTNENYSFFNEFYIKIMTELDKKFETTKINAISVVKKSKLHLLLISIKKLFRIVTPENILEN